MVEGLTCFIVDISQKEKSTVVCAAVDFLVYTTLYNVVTYPPDPLPLGISEGKGAYFLRGAQPLSIVSPRIKIIRIDNKTLAVHIFC